MTVSKFNLARQTLAATVCALAFAGAPGLASATTLTFAGFGAVNEDGTPDNGDSFASYTEAGYTLTPTGGDLRVAKATGNAIPAIYAAADTSNAAGTFDLTLGGGLFSFASLDIAAINNNVAFTFTGKLGAATLYSFSGVVTGRAFVFGSPVVFDTVMNPFSLAPISLLTVSVAGGSTSLTIDNLSVTAVPEPGSALLLALGLVGTAIARRRRA